MGLNPSPMPATGAYAFRPKGRFPATVPPVGLASRPRLGFVNPFTLTSALLTAPRNPAFPSMPPPGVPVRPAPAP